MFAETATKDIAQEENPQGFSENLKVAQSGGEVAKVARDALKKRTGKSVIKKSVSNLIRINKEIGENENDGTR